MDTSLSHLFSFFQGETALSAAVRCGASELVDLLLKESDEGPIHWKIDQKSLDKAFLHAFLHRDDNLMNRLLQRGATVNGTDNKGRTPLMICVIKANMRIAALLLENGAEVNAKDLRSHTALTLAAWKGRAEFVDLLLSRGADVNSRTVRGK